MKRLNPIEIGKRLREARIDKKIDVNSIASHTGLNKTTIYRYENGEVKNIKKPIIESLADMLDVNPLWVTGESEVKTRLSSNIGNKEKYEIDTFIKNIIYLRKNRGITQEDIANKANLSLNYYKKIENRLVDPTIGEVKRISEAFNLPTVDSLIFNDFKKIDINKKISNSQESSQTITVYGKVCAGNGVEAFEDPIDEITNPYHRIKKDLFSLQVHGDSMNNVVNDGIYAIIEKKETVNNGEIAVVLIDNEIGMLKRFYQLDESTVILKPDSNNTTHKAMIFENEEINRLKIIGRYLGHVSPMLDLL